MTPSEDSAVGTPIPAQTHEHPIHLYQPPVVPKQGGLPLDWQLPARPAVGYCRLNGQPIRVRHWTREEWERTPESDRPPLFSLDDQDGRFTIDSAE